MVAVFRAGDELPKEVFVHHNAGLAGYGGSSYIDSVILRDRESSTPWYEMADGTRDDRVYYAQNWRGDVSALLTDTGSMIEWVKYSAYGVPYALPAGDVDSNGSWSVQDEDTIAEAIEGGGAYDVRFDANLNGAIDYDDIAHANSIAGGYQTLGRGVQSSPAVANRVGYAGYRYDPTFKGASRTIYHVRHRVYDAEVGRWTRRDPLGYVDGMSLYEYTKGKPVDYSDPLGLSSKPIMAAQVPIRDIIDGVEHLYRHVRSCLPRCPFGPIPVLAVLPDANCNRRISINRSILNHSFMGLAQGGPLQTHDVEYTWRSQVQFYADDTSMRLRLRAHASSRFIDLVFGGAGPTTHGIQSWGDARTISCPARDAPSISGPRIHQVRILENLLQGNQVRGFLRTEVVDHWNMPACRGVNVRISLRFVLTQRRIALPSLNPKFVPLGATGHSQDAIFVAGATWCCVWCDHLPY